MNCEQVKELIPDWLDGEVDPVHADTIKHHINACASCREEAAFWRAVGTTLREDLEAVQAPPGFASGVMAQLPGRQDSGLKGLVAGWKRGIAAAAAFLLVAAGSAAGYVQWVMTPANHVAENNPPGQEINVDPGPGDGHEVVNPGPQDDPGGKDPGAQPGEDDPGSTGPDHPGDNNEDPGAGGTPGNGVDPSGGSGNGDNAAGDTINPGELALMKTDIDRVVERTFLKMKVEDFKAVHARALEYINAANARYEVITAENTGTGSQESLKIVVDNGLAGKLLENLKTLGQVVTTDSTRKDITAEYNAKVEQVSSLQARLEAAGDAQEREQLQVKIAGIMAQLKAWDKEAETKTIILWLEN